MPTTILDTLLKKMSLLIEKGKKDVAKVITPDYKIRKDLTIDQLVRFYHVLKENLEEFRRLKDQINRLQQKNTNYNSFDGMFYKTFVRLNYVLIQKLLYQAIDFSKEELDDQNEKDQKFWLINQAIRQINKAYVLLNSNSKLFSPPNAREKYIVLARKVKKNFDQLHEYYGENYSLASTYLINARKQYDDTMTSIPKVISSYRKAINSVEEKFLHSKILTICYHELGNYCLTKHKEYFEQKNFQDLSLLLGAVEVLQEGALFLAKCSQKNHYASYKFLFFERLFELLESLNRASDLINQDVTIQNELMLAARNILDTIKLFPIKKTKEQIEIELLSYKKLNQFLIMNVIEENKTEIKQVPVQTYVDYNPYQFSFYPTYYWIPYVPVLFYQDISPSSDLSIKPSFVRDPMSSEKKEIKSTVEIAKDPLLKRKILAPHARHFQTPKNNALDLAEAAKLQLRI